MVHARFFSSLDRTGLDWNTCTDKLEATAAAAA